MSDDRRRFRKIYTRIWRNPTFRQLEDAEKSMTLYLLSGPQTNRIGLFYLSIVTVADDLGWQRAETHARVERVCKAFGWAYDAISSVVWIPSWWDWNSPTENLKNMQGALSDLSDVPTTYLIERFAGHVVFVPPGLHKLFEYILEKHRRRTLSEHRANTDPEIVPQDKTRQDQTKQAGDGEALRATPTRTPDEPEIRRTAPIVAQSAHKSHACCGTVCLPSALFEDFVRRSRQHPDPDGYVRQFYREWDTRYAEGDRKAVVISGDGFDFWRARWKESHPEVSQINPAKDVLKMAREKLERDQAKWGAR